MSRRSPRKSLGQHWLDDEPSLRDICESAAITKQDVVLEIGPGLGSLTRLLIENASKVIAVELDEELAEKLPSRAKADNLEVISADILKFDLTKLPPGYKIVANIPYYLTGKLLRELSVTSNPPSTAVLLVQKEVAERVAADPGKLSVIAVTAQFYWRVQLGRVVPARLFTPPPKVDSQVLILNRRPGPYFEDVEPAEFFRLVKVGFAQPRKTLLNNLSSGLQCSHHEAQAICDRASIDSRRRAQTLSLEEWRSLYRSLHT